MKRINQKNINENLWINVESLWEHAEKEVQFNVKVKKQFSRLNDWIFWLTISNVLLWIAVLVK